MKVTKNGNVKANIAIDNFTITTSKGTVPDIGKNYCRKLQKADGYGYSTSESMMENFPACGQLSFLPIP